MPWVDRRPPGGFPHCVLDVHKPRAMPGRWYRGATVGPPGFEDPCYAHEDSVRELARDLGWLSPYQAKVKDERIAASEAEARQLALELSQARLRLQAVDLLMSASSDRPATPSPAAPDPDEQARQERVREARSEALARGRATAAANRAAKKGVTA